MSAASNPVLSQPEGFGKRLRHLAVGALFALVLLIPKILHVRRNSRSWMLFRIFLGVAGAALVVLPIGLGTRFVPAIVGLTMFISAILLPPAKPDANAGNKARELGALVIVNGGGLQPGNAPHSAPQLFLRAPTVWGLAPRLPPPPQVPVAALTAAFAH